MIDKSKKYWTGDSPEDIDQYLRLYAGEPGLEVRPVVCRGCGGDAFEVRVDREESVIRVKCAVCGREKYLLDCEEYRGDARPRLKKCPVCKGGRTFNVRVGLLRRESGSVRWAYVGNRCVDCGTLGSFLDWKIDYEPTGEMEQNI